MQRVAICYGCQWASLGPLAAGPARVAAKLLRWPVAAKLAIGALSDSLLSGMLEKLAARIGQGNRHWPIQFRRLGQFPPGFFARGAASRTRPSLAEDNRGRHLRAYTARLDGKNMTAIRAETRWLADRGNRPGVIQLAVTLGKSS